MDLKFNSWSIGLHIRRVLLLIAASAGSLITGPMVRCFLCPALDICWSSGDPWPHMLAAMFKVRRWFVQIRTRNSYNYLADWRLTGAGNTAPEIRLWMPTQGWNFLLVSLCLLSVVCYVDMLACCMRPCLHFPRLASITVCMTGALSAVTALLSRSLSQSNCRNWLPQLSSISSGRQTANCCYNCLLKIKHIFCCWIFPPMQGFTDIKMEWRVWDRLIFGHLDMSIKRSRASIKS